MNKSKLHIISFDVPYPANYGGAIDVFYRIKALAKLGVEITLHCYEYGRGQQPELEKYTSKIHYYKRRKSPQKWLSSVPFIVATRSSNELHKNLLEDDAPILFEGLHTTRLLSHSDFSNRLKMVRMHNIEHDYYNGLAAEAKGLKKKYFESEAEKLRTFEPVLKHADIIYAIKDVEAEHFKKYCNHVVVLPVSSSDREIDVDNTEEYFLFHGNLSVLENDSSAKWLIENVFLPLDLHKQLVIAGKAPNKELIQLCAENDIQLVQNPENDELDDLIQKARVHVLYSAQATGVKLKLVNAIKSPGHIVVSPKVVEGTIFSTLCNVANDNNEFQNLITEKIQVKLSETELNERRAFIKKHLNTVENCYVIKDLIDHH